MPLNYMGNFYLYTVKFLCFLLSLYTLSLSVMPCNDVHDGMASSVVTMQQAQEHHQTDNDVCSPFCICSCCQGFMAVTCLTDTVISLKESLLNFSGYSEQFISSAFASIWQPPKLS